MAHSVVLHVAAPRKHHARKHHTMRGGFSLGDILGPIGSVVKTALPIVSSLLGNGRPVRRHRRARR